MPFYPYAPPPYPPGPPPGGIPPPHGVPPPPPPSPYQLSHSPTGLHPAVGPPPPPPPLLPHGPRPPMSPHASALGSLAMQSMHNPFFRRPGYVPQATHHYPVVHMPSMPHMKHAFPPPHHHYSIPMPHMALQGGMGQMGQNALAMGKSRREMFGHILRATTRLYLQMGLAMSTMLGGMYLFFGNTFTKVTQHMFHTLGSTFLHLASINVKKGSWFWRWLTLEMYWREIVSSYAVSCI